MLKYPKQFGNECYLVIVLLVVLLISVFAFAEGEVVIPITKNISLASKEDQNVVMFLGYAIGFLVWIGRTIYELWVKKHDKTSEKLDLVLNKIIHIESKMDSVEKNYATKSELQTKIMEGIKWADEFRGKQ
jgi:hypothetical protein